MDYFIEIFEYVRVVGIFVVFVLNVVRLKFKEE